MSEMVWRKEPVEDLGAWFDDYTRRRYGKDSPMASQAWKTLMPGVLNSTLKETFSLMTELPKLTLVDNFAYDGADVFDAWDLIVAAAEADGDLGSAETFQ
jgi:hypothetical protein